jgi:hypothetical protein
LVNDVRFLCSFLLRRRRSWESSSPDELCSEFPSEVFSCTSPAAHTAHNYHTITTEKLTAARLVKRSLVLELVSPIPGHIPHPHTRTPYFFNSGFNVSFPSRRTSSLRFPRNILQNF